MAVTWMNGRGVPGTRFMSAQLTYLVYIIWYPISNAMAAALACKNARAKHAS
jgi:hypothetical protein